MDCKKNNDSHVTRAPWQPCGGWPRGVEAGSRANSWEASAAVQVGGVV